MKSYLKKTFNMLIGNYEIYWIYQKNLNSVTDFIKLPDGMDCRQLHESCLTRENNDFNKLSTYLGEQSLAYGLYVDNELVSVCFFWFGKRYEQRNFINLPLDSAKLIQITTSSKHQGKGYAGLLLNASTVFMKNNMFKQLFARVWHNHSASKALFTKNNWDKQNLKVKASPFGFTLSFTLPALW